MYPAAARELDEHLPDSLEVTVQREEDGSAAVQKDSCC